jgi:hypothetical protein
VYVNQSQVIDEIAEEGLKRRRVIEVRIMSGPWYLRYLGHWNQFPHPTDLVVCQPAFPCDDQSWARHAAPLVPIGVRGRLTEGRHHDVDVESRPEAIISSIKTA